MVAHHCIDVQEEAHNRHKGKKSSKTRAVADARARIKSAADVAVVSPSTGNQIKLNID